MRPHAMLSVTTVFLMAVGCAHSPGADLNANKQLVRDFTEAGNAADWNAFDRLLTDNFTRHSAATAGPDVTSRAGFVELQKSFLATFPDQRVTVRQLVAEGDRVAALATYSGTQTGPMGDFPVTGKAVEVPFLAMFRIESGRIAELWVEWDNVAILTQLGLFPPGAQPAT
jgi:steroid delta-isomerase-like uncharacterized protein